MGLNHALPETSETNFHHLILHGNDPSMITLLETKNPWSQFGNTLFQIQKTGERIKIILILYSLFP